MTSAWYFLEPLRNETQNFLISKLCFPWLVYTLTPSNSTHYYLTSAKLPFNTETTKKFPPEKKTNENLRTYSVTWQSTLGEYICRHQRAQFFIHDSNNYWRLVILWILVTLSTQKLIPWPRPTVSTPIFQPTFCPLSWQMSWLMTACDNSGKFCWPQMIRICRKCLAMFSMDTICIFQSYQRNMSL